jgi:FKBP-type peptidyl-prolyl cis-trans isomerases 1
MIKNLVLFLLAGLLLASCSKVSHRKTPGGMPYQLYKGKGGEKIYAGNFIKIQLTQKVKDSVYFTTDDKFPIYLPVSTPQPYDISETWTKLRVGDSIVAVQLMDTFIKRNPGSIPKDFKNGDRITTYVKILGVFTHDSLVTKDEKKMADEKLATEIKTVEKYLADKKINAQRTPSGAFVEVINPGTGNPIDSGKYVSVNYTGTTFAGVKFDSNTDSTFQHVGPYSFTIGAGEMIKGFDEGVSMLRMGGSGRVYTPSMLAYGPRPGSPLIKPFENLIFDVTVVDVKDSNPNARNLPPPPKVDMPQPK